MSHDDLDHPPHDQALIAGLQHPLDVLETAGLSKDEKRALLATWASDERAVLGAPTLRQLDNGAVVTLASIIAALKQLDGYAAVPSISFATSSDRRRNKLLTDWRLRARARGRRRDDDGDKPPPVPAASARLPAQAYQ